MTLTAVGTSRRRRFVALAGLLLRMGDVAGLTLLAGLLGFLFLSRESLWLDEAFSVKLAGAGWSTLWQQVSQSEASGSLYYFLLHFWSSFGRSEFAVRSLSVIAAAGAIPPFYATAKRLFGRQAARIASLLLATNSFFVYYAHEARSYALTLLLVVVASYCWTRWLDEPSPLWAALYAITAAAAVYAQIFSLFVIAAHAAALPARGRPRPNSKRLATVYVLLLMLLVPLMLYFAFGDTGHLWWVETPSFRVLARYSAELAGGGTNPTSVGLIMLVGYVAAGWFFLLRARHELQAAPASGRSWPYALVLTWLSFPTLGSFLASFWKPMFVDRYLIVALPALALLAGAGFASIADRRLRLAMVASLLVLSIGTLSVQYYRETKENWRDAENYVSAHARTGDAIIFYAPYVRIPFEYYLDHTKLRTQLVPVYPASAWATFDLAVDQSQRPDLPELKDAQRHYERIWLVLSHDKLNQTDATTANRLLRLLAACRPVHKEAFRGPISVTLYRRTSARCS